MARVSRPVRPVGRSGQGGHTSDLGIDRRSTDGQRGAGPEPNGPDALHAVLAAEVGSGGYHVVSPSIQAEITLRVTHPAHVRDHGHPTHLSGDAEGQFGKGGHAVGSAAWPAGKAVADHHAGPAVPAERRTGQVGDQAQVTGLEPVVLEPVRRVGPRVVDGHPVSPADAATRGTHDPAARRPWR